MGHVWTYPITFQTIIHYVTQNGRKSTENGHLPEARENASDQRPIALKFAPDWLKSWRDFQGQSQSTLRQERHHLIVDCNLL